MHYTKKESRVLSVQLFGESSPVVCRGIGVGVVGYRLLLHRPKRNALWRTPLQVPVERTLVWNLPAMTSVPDAQQLRFLFCPCTAQSTQLQRVWAHWLSRAISFARQGAWKSYLP